MRAISIFMAAALSVGTLLAQAPPKPAASAPPPAVAAPKLDPVTGLAPPPGYIIGPDDVLVVSFWRDDALSSEGVVRPDGKISLKLINEIQAAGLTTEELRKNVTAAATKFIEDPVVSIVVKQINSRKVYITGAVNKPGVYQLTDHMTVIQLITTAGGLQEFADKENIVIVRGTEKRPDGVPWSFVFNYLEFSHRKNLQQNIELRPGDSVIVP